MVGYLDPSSAAVGYVGAVAVNIGLGGNDSDLSPAVNYFKELQ
jgi:putative spermidine/putrescine transport system substrate-binding protein